jgi:hypothetical protein
MGTGGKDFGKDLGKVGFDLIVSEAEDAVAMVDELGGTGFIIVGFICVDTTIQLDHQSGFGAKEIGDIRLRPKGVLSAKF